MATNIPHSLIEAYKGYYEEEIAKAWDDHVSNTSDKDYPNESEDSFATDTAKAYILSNSPKQRLAIYLEWNGIIGYDEQIWNITQDEY